MPGLLNQKSQVTRTNIKAAILQTAGPVSTCEAIRCNWRFLRCITKKHFLAASAELQSSSYGSLVSINSRMSVFLKRPPEEILPMLANHPELCLPEVYNARYHLPPMKVISQKIRYQLVNMGLVRPEQM